MKIVLSIFRFFKIPNISIRFYYGVHHNSVGQMFYVKLDNNDNATLWYKKHDNILDLRAVYVPKNYENQGIARLLTEAALTYAIVNDYNLFLSCGYVQNLYLKTKTPELEARVVGPPKILEKS